MNRNHTLAAALLGSVVSIAAVSMTTLGASADLATHRIRAGSIGDGQTVAALETADQSGTNDNWNNYVEFEPDDDGRHVSVFIQTFDNVGETATINLNYRGPEAAETTWRLRVRNVETSRWETVFDNVDADEWVWSDSAITLDAPDYLDTRGRMRLVWVSNNDNEVGQLDELTVTMSGSAPPTTAPPTTAPPTTTPPTTTAPPAAGWVLPPVNAAFDYQIGGAYTPPSGVTVVSRDWFDSAPLSNGYSICYVNAFQTQPDGDGSRPDEKSAWPQNLLLLDLGDDPNWGGEYLVDLSTASNREQAAAWLAPMIETCAAKGYDAVEFDNLDSWTRFEGTPVASQMPFGQSEAVAFAALITDIAHDEGLAVGQKNTSELEATTARTTIGFDFAIAEQCGEYEECTSYTDVYGPNVIAIEYTTAGFNEACATIGDAVSVVRRDVNVSTPGAGSYIYDAC